MAPPRKNKPKTAGSKRAFTRESAIAAGFVEGQDFVRGRAGTITSLRKNVDRVCERCTREMPARSYYSGLHKWCRRCIFREEAGIEPGSPRDLLADAKAEESARQHGRPQLTDEQLKPVARASKLYEKELAQRMLARRRLIHFIKRFQPGYKDGWVHHDICRRLERFLQMVVEGKSPRLLIFCPPRLGKSLIASQYFPAWALGHHPELEFIAASYNVSLPMGFSRRIRETLRDSVYQAMFSETRLSEENQAAEAWRTTAGGGYVAAGVGTGITGKGAHVFVVDDPVKDMEAADSQTIREGAWEWWTSTAYTRIAPGGGVLGIQTRWNDDDWAGRILVAMSTGEGEHYEVCSYPAINEEGDEYLLADDTIRQIPASSEPPEGATLLRPVGSALHPARYNIEHLQRIKRNLIASGQRRVWSALYQQNPVPDEGAFFRKDMFRYVAHAPRREQGRVFQTWDFSITEKETSDWIVGACMLQDENDNVFELDMTRFKVDEDGEALADAVLDFKERWGAWIVGLEDGQIFKSIKSSLIRRARERRIAFNYEVLQPLTDKLVRAGPLRGRMQMGKMYFVQSAPYRATVDNELLRFPGGKHDDIVDAYAWCTRLILNHAAVPTKMARAERKRREQSVAQKLRQYGRGAHKVGHMSA
jgi:predicted phage terminase large subunit-like protein